jgi:hypothetical protein
MTSSLEKSLQALESDLARGFSKTSPNLAEGTDPSLARAEHMMDTFASRRMRDQFLMHTVVETSNAAKGMVKEAGQAAH